MPEPTYRFDERGLIVLSHVDAWWCVDCGRFRHCNEYRRCGPCESAAINEARAIANAVMERIASPEPSLRDHLDAWGAR